MTIRLVEIMFEALMKETKTPVSGTSGVNCSGLILQKTSCPAMTTTCHSLAQNPAIGGLQSVKSQLLHWFKKSNEVFTVVLWQTHSPTSF